MSVKEIAVMADIYQENDRVAENIRQNLKSKGVYAVNLIGAPGTGKTSCLIRVIEGLKGVGCSVIEGDIQSDIDTEKLRLMGISAVQINTGGACHIEAVQIQKALEKLSLEEKSLLFIENIGNLVCPAEFDIGEDIKILAVTVAEGSDKPYKYPLAFKKAGAVILNKADLLPYVDFDADYFYKGVRALNPKAPIFKVSAKTGEGFDEVCAWLKSAL